MDKKALRENRKQRLPSVTAFSLRDSLSKLNFPLSLPKEFSQMEQKLRETHPREGDNAPTDAHGGE